MQLIGLAAAAAAVLASWPGPAAADGELILRGAYYKERATRVEQPMIDARFDVGVAGEVTAHALVDAITSASVAAGATGEPFDEYRYEVGGGYLHRLGDLRIGGSLRISDEPDYQSVFLGARGELELADKNTVLGLTLGRGLDHASNGINSGGLANPVEGDLDSSLGSLSASQILNRYMVAGVTYDLSYLSGFQENPYRSVAAGGVAEPERVPDTRTRHALFGSLRAYVPPSRSTLVAGYRLYVDDWGITGHTPEVRVIQDIGAGVEVRLRYRFYTQSAADFYKDVYDSADPAVEPFLTDDPKLSSFRTQTFGIQLGAPLSLVGAGGALTDARIEGLFEYIAQTSRFGEAFVGSLAVTVPFAY